MFKKLLCLLLLMFTLPVYSGELEDALVKDKPVFLYIYTPSCGYCKRFNPVYSRIFDKYKAQYTFVKIDATTVYGAQKAGEYQVRYVPYVLLINSKNSEKEQIKASCLLDFSCVDGVLKNFK